MSVFIRLLFKSMEIMKVDKYYGDGGFFNRPHYTLYENRKDVIYNCILFSKPIQINIGRNKSKAETTGSSLHHDLIVASRNNLLKLQRKRKALNHDCFSWQHRSNKYSCMII